MKTCERGFFRAESLTLTLTLLGLMIQGLPVRKPKEGTQKAELFSRPCVSLSLRRSVLKGALSLLYSISSA